MHVAIDAGQSQVLSIVAAAVLFRQHVLDLQRRQRGVILLQAAVLAMVLGTGTDEAARFDVHARSTSGSAGGGPWLA
jgi:hypothetical protein